MGWPVTALAALMGEVWVAAIRISWEKDRPKRAEFISAQGLWRTKWDWNPRLPDCQSWGLGVHRDLAIDRAASPRARTLAGLDKSFHEH